MDKAFYNQRFDSIQALRGLAAISVILHHIQIINNGSFGVDIFFVVSGFIMMYVTQISARAFLLKRYIRIIPLYYFVTLITIAAYYFQGELFDNTVIDASYIIKSLLFVPFSKHPIVKVGWTLNYEMFFYIVLWIAMKISYKYRSLIASFIIILIIPLTRHFGIDSSIMIEFIYGMAAFHILSSIDYDKIKMPAAGRYILLLISFSCYAFMWSAAYFPIFDGIDRFLLKGIPSFILFSLFFVACYSVTVPRIFVYVGDISYSVYLLHYFITRLCNKFLTDIPIVLMLAIVFFLIFLLSSISYKLFEKRLNSWLRNKLGL